MEITLAELRQLRQDSFYVTVQGKLVYDWSEIKEHDKFHVHLRILGGKGGFGSLLRSFGSQFYKSTNQDMCRDLSGRRLKDVKEEERLKKYIEKAASREREKRQKLEEKYKRLKQLDERKHEFNDTEYNRQRERILEETEEALRAGLKAAAAEAVGVEEAGPSGIGDSSSSSSTTKKQQQQSLKRKHSDAATASGSSSSSSGTTIEKTKAKKKKVIAGDLWLGVAGLNEEDLDSNSDSNSSDTEEGEKDKPEETIPAADKKLEARV